MTYRTTKAQLEAKVRMINLALGQSTEPMTRNADGKLVWTRGVYTIGGAYGGYRIERIANDGGGIHSITNYDTKKATYVAACAILEGIFAAHNAAEVAA